MKIGIVGFLIGFTFLSAQGQTKMEIERRIPVEEVPQPAIQWLQKYRYAITSKIKWYYEADGPKKSFEGKFQLHRHRYSIEFDSEGYFEDMEILYPKRSLPEPIIIALERDAKKFSIKRSQIQFKAVNKELFEPEVFRVVSKLESNTLFELEVVLEGQFYELLMDSRGNILSKRRIVSPTGIHLEF